MDCAQCPAVDSCPGCASTGGKPFGGTCVLGECCKAQGCGTPGSCFSGTCAVKEQLIREFNDLHIPHMGPVTDLNALPGSYINLEYTLPGGQKVKFWEEAYKRGEVTKDAILQSFGAWDAHAAYGDTHELRAKYAKKVEAIIGEPVEIHRKLNGNRAVRDKRRLRQCRNLYKKQHQNRETEKSGSFSYAQRPTDVPPWADS